MKTLPSCGLNWISGSGESSEVVLSTRVRLARNIQGFRFGNNFVESDGVSVLNRVRSSLQKNDYGDACVFLEFDKINRLQQRILLERRLVSPELVGTEEDGPPSGSALILGPNDGLSVMVNEEDHLRIQPMFSGLALSQAWHMADEMDELLGSAIPFAYHNEYGFLTS